MAGNDKIPDAEQLRQIFAILSEALPELLEKITNLLYDAQEGEKFGLAVAGFYKTLIAAGMTNEQAFALTKEYMNNISLGGMLKNIVGGAQG